ncbi:hypothetical protein PILCRDRAFT_91675 [Piloderma croceum F 1598]|uniref:Uncharacterized protein n=1 Tax=Piloderma croceum (strain F 1598) TaxID=765440 RepID=A0A0C3EUU8_PILCF|nr:hypothetical protein PILCRDRAFT_91675 [Piloderma croceum F 1598]
MASRVGICAHPSLAAQLLRVASSFWGSLVWSCYWDVGVWWWSAEGYWAQHYLPTRLYSLFPRPTQDSSEKRRYIVMLLLTSRVDLARNADIPRALVRDMYMQSWSACDRLVAIVPPGGSIGLDDKLFSFWRQLPLLPHQWDLPLRNRHQTPVSSARGRENVAQTPPPPPNLPWRSSSVTSSLGLPFDPVRFQPSWRRIQRAPMFVPTPQVDSARVVPHRNAPASGFPAGWGVYRAVGGEERGGGLLLAGRVLDWGLVRHMGMGHLRLGLGLLCSWRRWRGVGMGLLVQVRVGGFGFGENALHVRTQTSSTVDSGTGGSSSLALGGGSTAFMTPDLNTGLGSPDPNTGGPPTPMTTTTTALIPVTAVPTADAEAQIGLAKAAQPDVDAFMTYAPIVPDRVLSIGEYACQVASLIHIPRQTHARTTRLATPSVVSWAGNENKKKETNEGTSSSFQDVITLFTNRPIASKIHHRNSTYLPTYHT